MNEEPHRSESSAVDENEGLDPQVAAALLEQTTRHAQRQFDFRSPLLTLIGAAVVLVAYGAVWLSVRGQHPYSGPAGWALAVLYSTVIVWGVLVSTFYRRARAGVSGRSARQQRLDGVAFVTIWASVYVFQGALEHAGASHAIVYGIYPAAAPLVIVGSAAASYTAANGNWPWLGFALAAVILGATGAFTGPARAWAVVGVGLSVLLLGRATLQVWLRRA